MERMGSTAWFALWVIAGIFAVSALAAVIPLGVLGLVTIAIAVGAERAGRLWPEALGLLVGIGAVAFMAGMNNVGPPPACSQVDPATTTSCRGVPPTPFLVVGGGLVIAGLGGYVGAKRVAAESPTD